MAAPHIAPPVPTPARARGGRPRHGGARAARLADRALPILSVIAVLALLEFLSRTHVLRREFFPPITEDFAELFRQLGKSSFWSAVGDTMKTWAVGAGVAALLAIPIGIVAGASDWVYRGLRVLIEFLRPIPSVALIPFAVLVYGTGMKGNVFLVVFASFWPLLIQTIYGVQDVDPVAMDTARAFGFGRFSRMWRVTLPSALPYIATGLRITSTVALVLAVTSELVIGTPGLGHSVDLARTANQVTVVFALTIATGLLGWGLNVLTLQAERRVLRWHVPYRSRARSA